LKLATIKLLWDFTRGYVWWHRPKVFFIRLQEEGPGGEWDGWWERAVILPHLETKKRRKADKQAMLKARKIGI